MELCSSQSYNNSSMVLHLTNKDLKMQVQDARSFHPLQFFVEDNLSPLFSRPPQSKTCTNNNNDGEEPLDDAVILCTR